MGLDHGVGLWVQIIGSDHRIGPWDRILGLDYGIGSWIGLWDRIIGSDQGIGSWDWIMRPSQVFMQVARGPGAKKVRLTGP